MGPGGLLRREHMTVSRGERVPRIPSPSNSCSGRFGYQTVYRKSFSVQSSADLGIAGEGLWVLPNAAVAATKIGICPCNPIQFSQLYEQDADISASRSTLAGFCLSTSFTGSQGWSSGLWLPLFGCCLQTKVKTFIIFGRGEGVRHVHCMGMCMRTHACISKWTR